MKHSRRLFFKQGLAGALLLGTSAIAKAGLPDPVKTKGSEGRKSIPSGNGGIYFR